MSIATLGAAGSPAWTQAASSVTRAPEAAERPGPDHDGDGDDSLSVSSQSGAMSATTPGVGSKVNTLA
jgi:hypothetical protein